ncbi:hypothetical protein [Pseudomonas aeruginosa]|uniref:hypothetical protein n=1 Tax=Pseudomonas aeruginosa TaxID=287 RepID=UPI00157FDA63|nr:hypothetical protein [Pseudomonas aeruginosa]
MNKANECTCPSGNGSLVHPCPTHPAVEQAGGDERAAFELFVRKHCGMPAHIAVNWDAKFTNDAWEGWKARAALAQPSPDAPYADDIAADLERSDWTPEDALRWYAAGKHFDTVNGRTRIIDTGAVASNALKHLSLPYLEMKGDAELTELREAMAQPSPAQAEAERPEVVAYRTIGRHEKHQHPHYALNYYKQNAEDQAAHWRERGCEVSEDELMTVAQHDRIFGALRAKADQLREALEWRKENQAGQRELLRSVTAERDAALARVAELERQEPVGSAYGVLPPFAEKVLAKLRRFYVCAEDFESGGVDIGRHWLDLLTQLGLLNRVQRSPAFWEISQQGEDLLEAPVAQAQHSVPEGLAEFSQFLSAVMDAAGLVRYGRRSKELSEYLGAQCMKYRLSAPVAQAQHSGPEEFSFEYRHPNGESHTVTVSRDQVISEMPDFLLEALCSKFCNCEPVGETNVVECCCDEYAEEFKLLAAAPGKEVPQAWLDVQAERRRQVEVEGYHGFRDNHYISYELSKAARAYIEVSWHALSGGLPCKKPESWPWMAGFKWSDGRTMLVKAGALILAEIERLDRAAPGKEVGHE